MGLLVLLVLVIVFGGLMFAIVGSLVGLLLTLLMAGLVGWAADMVVPGQLPGGWIGAVLAGLIGGFIGGSLFHALGIRLGFSLFGIELIPAFVGGFVGTGFNHNNGGLMRVAMWLSALFARRPDQGAETLVWLADSPEVSQTSGAYFVDKRTVRPSQAARDMDHAARLWQVSEATLAATAPGRA
jgi:uncharacterized membrane protein YeaQ/YmgE (transglycosylase-associated protein family)